MKRIFPVLILSAVMLTSCFEGSDNYMPGMQFSLFTNQNNDTIYPHYVKDYTYRLDTLHVGDTVNFGVAFVSYANALTAVQIEHDSSYVSLTTICDSIFKGGVDKYLAATSDTANLRFDFLPGTLYNFMSMPLTLIPRKAGNSAMVFNVASDAESSKIPNTYTTTINLVVK